MQKLREYASTLSPRPLFSEVGEIDTFGLGLGESPIIMPGNERDFPLRYLIVGHDRENF